MATASLPSREAWIEISPECRTSWASLSRFPRGKRGLKWISGVIRFTFMCRFPRGKRGLKCRNGFELADDLASLPSREAWIEINLGASIFNAVSVASLAGSVD